MSYRAHGPISLSSPRGAHTLADHLCFDAGTAQEIEASSHWLEPSHILVEFSCCDVLPHIPL
jgi:hypothetical protein